jgi:signal transduction histidine kinase
MEILDEASQVHAYSRALEHKSRELEAATAELRKANEQLKQVDRLKDDFMSTVTHELRTPLTSIRAFSEILIDNPDLDVDEQQRFLQPIVDETERLTRLFNQVLDLSMLESGAGNLRAEPVDLSEVVAASSQATAQLFRDSGVRLDVDGPDRLPLVLADRDRVVQVVLNLLSNAVKFAGRDAGRVLVRASAVDGVARVDVHDNGPGIPVQDQAVVFDRFRQGGDARRERPQGTGLGLPISREIIEQLGGRLWVTSEPGAGATFSFTLPVASQRAARAAGTEG